jgi:cobalamin biosynthesis protein CobD/CbiB
MWDVVVEAAQSPALHWTVVVGAVLALIYKVLSTSDAPLMGDIYRDDLDN